MIVVDTSVLIDYLRTKDAKLLGLIQKHGGAVCGVIRAEILCGAQNVGHRRLVTEDWRNGQQSLESAADLLQRLQLVSSAARQRVLNEVTAPPPTDDVDLFEIPEEWRWVVIRRLMDEREPFCYGVVQRISLPLSREYS